MICRWREEENDKWVRKEKLVTDFYPYLFLDPSNFFRKKINKNGRTIKFQIRSPSDIRSSLGKEIRDSVISHRDDDGKHYRDAEGNALWRVEFPYPGALNRFRRLFGPSYEGDVPYGDRYAIDNIDEMKPYKMRKLFVDLEALQFRKGHLA
ncbi:uncharacterized protein METZ01_LOCUS325410, partial [marine metagenome]